MIWVIGAGPMARSYIDVLKVCKREFKVIGRSKRSSDELSIEKSVEVVSGGLSAFLETKPEVVEFAIVAVQVELLKDITCRLIEAGVKTILVEKPAGLDFEEIAEISNLSKQNSVAVYVAYNRRFYSSVLEAKKLIDEDGGVESFHFEFTEWADSIGKLDKDKRTFDSWLLANSSHVIDTAFYLAGKPESMSSYVSGEGQVDWHDQSSKYSGAGVTLNGALFSYCANWDAPGRWSIELMTRNNRYILRPMEKLQIQKRNTVSMDYVDLEDSKDNEFKPGLYDQVVAFLDRQDDRRLCAIDELVSMKDVYQTIEYGGNIGG